MAKDRFIQCKYYINEGNCSKGREGTFYGQCQHCNKYQAVKGGIPAKKDLRQEKRNKQLKRDMKGEY